MPVKMYEERNVQFTSCLADICPIHTVLSQNAANSVLSKKRVKKVASFIRMILARRNESIIKKHRQQSSQPASQRAAGVERPDRFSIMDVVGKIVVEHNLFPGEPLNMCINERLTDQRHMTFDDAQPSCNCHR